MMRRYLGYIMVLPVVAMLLSAQTVNAAVPSLELAPLKYQATIESGAPKTGYITVSNPSDTSVTVRSQIQGVRQTGTDGRLQFYDDTSLTQGITISSDNVVLSPHEAVNFQFLIDPDHLPQGGVYAVIFFQTVPQSSGQGTQVLTSARVGTLLLLQNGNAGRRNGRITHIDMPRFVYASALSGTVTYRNTGSVAQNPSLALSNGGFDQIDHGPYILPLSQRSFGFTVRGDQIGPVRVKFRDLTTGVIATRWAIAVTGYWQWLFPALLIIFGALISYRFARRRHLE